MANLDSLGAPREIVELGTPDIVHRSSEVTRGMLWTTWIVGPLALLLGGGLLFLHLVAQVIPPHGAIIVYILSVSFIGGAVVLFASIAVMNGQRPKYLYAFFPQGLVVLQGRKWDLVPWKTVVTFEPRGEPHLALTDHGQVPIRHDFPNGADLFADLAHYVHEKNRLLGRALPSEAGPPKFSQSAALQLLAGAGLVGGAAVLAVFFWDQLALHPRPPRLVTHEELVKLKDPTELEQTAVRFTCADVVKTKAEITKTRNFITVTESKLVLIPVKDHYLIANVQNDFTGNATVKGELGVWKGDGHGRHANRRKDAAEQVRAEFPQLKGKMLPYQLDATYVPGSGGQGLTFGLTLAAAVGVSCLVRGHWLSQRPEPRGEV